MGRARESRKLTVEESLCLDALNLRQGGLFSAGFGATFTCRWRRPTCVSDCVLDGKVLELPGLAMGLLMSYEVSDGRSLAKRSMEYVIGISASRCYYGGRRFWLRCPLLCNGVRCGRRVRRLYLPPGETAFGCRFCHDLTYQSCRESDKRVSFLARSPELLSATLELGTIRQQLLATSALTLLIKRINRPSARGKTSWSKGRYAAQM